MSYITPSIFYFSCIMLVMYIGDAISNKSGGKIPQMFVVAIIFLLAFLSGVFPKNLLDISGVNTLYGIVTSMILIHVGTLFNFKDIVQHYKVVLVIISAMIGICLLCGVIGYLIYGADIAAAAIAPLTGGGMAAIIINQAASVVHKPELGLFALMIFLFHGVVGLPLTAWFLRKECQLQLIDFATRCNLQATSNNPESIDKPILIQRLIPQRYRNPLFYLTELAILGVLSDYVSHITSISYAIIEIVIGITAKYCGILENKPLDKSDSSTILLTSLFAWFMGAFANTTLAQIYHFVTYILVLMAIACLAIVIFCIPLGKKLGFSKYLSLAIGFNCFLGFPFNFALTNEAIRSNAKDSVQENYLYEYLMPKMIVAGVVSVSLLSTVIAGLIASFYFHARLG